jgi:hypothetical protein
MTLLELVLFTLIVARAVLFYFCSLEGSNSLFLRTSYRKTAAHFSKKSSNECFLGAVSKLMLPPAWRECENFIAIFCHSD